LGARVPAATDNAMFHYSDYLREQATKYRELAEQAEDPVVKKEFLELAGTCEEVANDLDDRRASG
jgi:sirohydrochlorin ferrochelatase